MVPLGGADELKQAFFVDWFIEEKVCAGFKTHRHGAGRLIVADEDNGVVRFHRERRKWRESSIPSGAGICKSKKTISNFS